MSVFPEIVYDAGKNVKFLLNTFVKINKNKDCSFWIEIHKEISKKNFIRFSLYSSLHIWYIFCKKRKKKEINVLFFFTHEKVVSYYFLYEKLKLSYDIDYLCKVLPKARARFRPTCFEYYIVETIKFELHRYKW